MPSPRLTDVHGLAEYLGSSESHVRKLVARREIPFVRVGRSIRFDLRKIDTWIDAHTVEPSPRRGT